MASLQGSWLFVSGSAIIWTCHQTWFITWKECVFFGIFCTVTKTRPAWPASWPHLLLFHIASWNLLHQLFEQVIHGGRANKSMVCSLKMIITWPSNDNCVRNPVRKRASYDPHASSYDPHTASYVPFHPKRKLLFQPSIFRWYVSFREGNTNKIYYCWWFRNPASTSWGW